MPVYFYWGEDDFAIAKAVKQLQGKILDDNWLEFNFHRYQGDRQEVIIEALNEVMTPPFGMGGRLVWLNSTTICQQCSADLLAELTSTLPVISDDSHLLFTTSKKPDGRLKSSKLLKKFAEVKEFNLIPFWDEQGIKKNIRQLAAEIGVKLSPSAVEALKDFVGNDTRQLWNELEKLSIYQHQASNKIIDAEAVNSLVICNTQNSLKLAEAIRDSQTETALSLINDLLNRNEPPLKMVATLVRQFRMWTTVKVIWEAGEREYKSLAKIAEISGNPNRIKYILNDIQKLSATQLLSTLSLLLELEYSLKKGAEPYRILPTTALKICQLLSKQ
ncbi:DNA polymerase III, delta subunit [Hyella patelloides LEGE 07179]|uniref:DNA polymerase III subunit delta n=1 Tax=Hyella patelloides LEGE 07179 TaxID=945734 RepID=A0A563VPW0_9CYAN|nr:DNA polymerase III subunit delta [Hyella patelloides]VEP13395.1 DNA polymerase III, delta subunit [Hyella patelloides LEGE 07179]